VICQVNTHPVEREDSPLWRSEDDRVASTGYLLVGLRAWSLMRRLADTLVNEWSPHGRVSLPDSTGSMGPKPHLVQVTVRHRITNHLGPGGRVRWHTIGTSCQIPTIEAVGLLNRGQGLRSIGDV
jgi:hypothetical protein